MSAMDNNLNSQGFTLLEVTVAIVISGFLLAASISLLNTYLDNTRGAITRERLETITLAMKTYIRQNNSIPCPAQRFGYAAADLGLSLPDCDATIVAAGTDVTNDEPGRGLGAGMDVRIGAVPFRSLNLSEDFMYDGWKRKFTYAAIIDATDPATYTHSYTNGIALFDRRGNSVVEPPRSLSYIVLSHGEDGRGAFGASPTNTAPVAACTPLTTLQSENCNGGVAFTTTLRRTERRYDDIVFYQGAPDGDAIPLRAVMAFRGACPRGWQLLPANVSAGRMIMGAGTYNHTILPNVANYDGGQIDYPNLAIGETIGANGGSVSHYGSAVGGAFGDPGYLNMPPYVVFNYCEKI